MSLAVLAKISSKSVSICKFRFHAKLMDRVCILHLLFISHENYADHHLCKCLSTVH